jgi:opine dehydrogenase
VTTSLGAPERITVLGGGNTSFSIAAHLALGGHQVVLWEHPDFAHTIEPLRGHQIIHLEGAGRTGAARLAAVTTDIAEALAWSNVILMAVPAYAHRAFAEACAPHLRAGQLVALLPGTLGSLAFGQILHDAGVDGVVLAESDSAPYVCRKIAPDRAVIWGVLSALGFGVLPARRTAETMDVLGGLFPGARAYPDVLTCGLSSLNPIVHPPGVLMNAGRIERSRGDFYFYEEGVTPAVVRAIEAVDAERLALGAALGVDLAPVAVGYHAAGFGPAGDLWATINGSRMLTALRAPGAVDTRWLTEDVPFGLVTWSSLAADVDVPTPVMDALTTLASAVLDRDMAADGRTSVDLGLHGRSAAERRALLEEGWPPTAKA